MQTLIQLDCFFVKFVAETTLENSLLKLGISKYKFIEELPEYLSKKLKENN